MQLAPGEVVCDHDGLVDLELGADQAEMTPVDLEELQAPADPHGRLLHRTHQPALQQHRGQGGEGAACQPRLQRDLGAGSAPEAIEGGQYQTQVVIANIAADEVVSWHVSFSHGP